jgi:hypothetical protein
MAERLIDRMEGARYSRGMEVWNIIRFLSVSLSVILPAHLLAVCGARTVVADSFSHTSDPVLAEEYAIYDRVIQAKFLTSETSLVMIDRQTVTQLGPGEEWDNRRFLQENDFFDGGIQPALFADFIRKLERPSRLEPKFNFGVRYRLVSDKDASEEEVSLAPIPVIWRRKDAPTTMLTGDVVFQVEYDGATIVLEFSRVAFTPQADQALVYVGNYRTAGGGAGFLILLDRQSAGWHIRDSEVIWTARIEPR